MLSAISTSPSTSSGTVPRRSPSLDAQLSTARNQLEDWVTCPSAKTPQGKEKIREITDKFDSIKHQMKQADAAAAQAKSEPAGAESQAPSAPAPTTALGNSLDVYA